MLTLDKIPQMKTSAILAIMFDATGAALLSATLTEEEFAKAQKFLSTDGTLPPVYQQLVASRLDQIMPAVIAELDKRIPVPPAPSILIAP